MNPYGKLFKLNGGDVFNYITDIDLAVMRIGELYENDEYELEKFYPTKLEGTIPTIEELEKQL